MWRSGYTILSFVICHLSLLIFFCGIRRNYYLCKRMVRHCYGYLSVSATSVDMIQHVSNFAQTSWRVAFNNRIIMKYLLLLIMALSLLSCEHLTPVEELETRSDVDSTQTGGLNLSVETQWRGFLYRTYWYSQDKLRGYSVLPCLLVQIHCFSQLLPQKSQ